MSSLIIMQGKACIAGDLMVARGGAQAQALVAWGNVVNREVARVID